MKTKFTVLAFLLFISFFSFGQETIFHEDFEGSTMPSGWSQSNFTGGNGTWNWTFGSGEFGWSGGEAYEFTSNAAIFDDLLNSDNTSHDVRLLAYQGINLSQYESLSLEYEFSLNVLITTDYYGILKVVIYDQSISGWRTFQIYQNNVTTRVEEHDLEAFLTSYPGISRSNFRFGFVYDDEGKGYTKAAGIGDVKINGKIINDSCEQSFWLQPGGITHSSKIGCDYSDPYGYGAWYHYVNTNSTLRLAEIWVENAVNTGGVEIHIYQGNCGALTPVIYGSDEADKYFEAYPGDDYYIFIRANNYYSIWWSKGTFDIGFIEHDNPLNDEAANAIAIPLIEYYEYCQSPTIVDNTGATTSWVNGIMQYDYCDASRSDVWVKFVAPSTGQVKAILETESNWSKAVFGLYDSPTATSEIESYKCYIPSSFLIGSLIPGNTYYLRLYSCEASDVTFNRFGTLEFCLQVNTPPANNDCTGATELGCNASLTGSLVNATVSLSPSCNEILYRNLWYHFSSTNGGTVAFWVNANQPIKLMIFEGTCGSLNCVVNVMDSNPYFEIETTPGKDYYISVGSEYADNFTIHSSCTTPINDEADNAVEMTVNAIGVACTNPTMVYNNNGATDSYEINGIPDCRDYEGGDLWYKFQAPASGGVKIVRPNAGDWGPMGYAIYQAAESTTAIACHYIQGATTTTESDPITGLTPGNYYWLRVWEWENDYFGSVGICLTAVDTEGLDQLESLGFTYSPNPVKDVLYLSAKVRMEQISVYNSLGQELIKNFPSNLEYTLDVSKLTQGTYFVKIYIGNQIGTYQIIKE